jgi:hypothetical protein
MPILEIVKVSVCEIMADLSLDRSTATNGDVLTRNGGGWLA